MARKSTSTIPKLFKRGKKGNYYFRRLIEGKDKWICTETTTHKEAIKFANAYIDAETVTRAEAKRNSTAHKLGNSFVEVFTNKPQVFTTLEDAHQIWIDHFPGYKDVNKTTMKSYDTVFNKFVDWCKDNEIKYIESVDNSAAIKYSKHLWEEDYTGSTYNSHLKHLSRVFNKIDSIKSLPNRNPFSHHNVPRIKKNQLGTIGHEPLEPEMLEAVIAEAAKESRSYRDLIIIASQTGMRLIDAALLEFSSIQGDFLEFEPRKTRHSGNIARVPISKVLRQILNDHADEHDTYVLPDIAEHYLRNSDYVTKMCRSFFINALGEDIVNIKAEDIRHRKRAAVIYSFHSLRTTFMSLLASKDVSTRDAMRMMAWESPAMIQVYEKMLERARGDSDARAMALVNSIEELDYEVPECIIEKQLKPTGEALAGLVSQYSNVTIGKIYNMSDVAVKKWMKKFGITRPKRILSSNVSEEEINEIQKKLLEE